IVGAHVFAVLDTVNNDTLSKSLKRMAGTTGVEPAAFAVTEWQFPRTLLYLTALTAALVCASLSTNAMLGLRCNFAAVSISPNVSPPCSILRCGSILIPG